MGESFFLYSNKGLSGILFLERLNAMCYGLHKPLLIQFLREWNDGFNDPPEETSGEQRHSERYGGNQDAQLPAVRPMAFLIVWNISML